MKKIGFDPIQEKAHLIDEIKNLHYYEPAARAIVQRLRRCGVFRNAENMRKFLALHEIKTIDTIDFILKIDPYFMDDIQVTDDPRDFSERTFFGFISYPKQFDGFYL